MVLPLRSLSFPMSFRNTHFRSHVVLPQRISVSRHHSPVFWSKCNSQNVKPQGNLASDDCVGVLVCFRSPSVTITSGKYGRYKANNICTRVGLPDWGGYRKSLGWGRLTHVPNLSTSKLNSLLLPFWIKLHPHPLSFLYPKPKFCGGNVVQNIL